MDPQWPLILAGPVLRRVEPTQAAVWIALSEPRRVRLMIWPGLATSTSSSGTFTPADPELLLFAAEVDTVRVGDRLHIAVVTCFTGGETPFQPNTLYSYNVTLIDENGVKEDLLSLGLLRDDDTDPLKSHRALGYVSDTLPGFAMPPTSLDDLRLVHGSCRKPHGPGRDGLYLLDHLIEANRQAPAERPHQFFMTGDQIYADDIALALLPKLNEIGRHLLGSANEQLPAAGQLWDATITNFPSARRHTLILNEAGFTCNPGETDSHILSFGEYAALYLCMWANVVWPASLATEQELFGPANPTPPAQLEALLKPLDKVQDLRSHLTPQRRDMIDFLATLPYARRALANVPTFTIFDDHDVTDDWYLSRAWRNRVLQKPLGRAVVRNALVAYGLFQGWGNDPFPFTQTGQDPRARFLEKIPGLFPTNAAGPDPATAAAVETLLGMDEAEPTSMSGKVQWHYTVPGPEHQVVVTDTRTWRHSISLNSPPSLIHPNLINQQIPEPPPPGSLIQVTLIVSSMPVLGLPTSEELLQPAFNRIFDAKFALGSGHAGAEIRDPEPWAFEPYAFEALLKRLQGHKRVVVLSGETHYALTAALSYWKKKNDALSEEARIVQLTGSSFKNVEADKLALVKTPAAQFVFEQAALPVERLGWDEEIPQPVTVVGGEPIPAAHHQRLDRRPVFLGTHGWPEGTVIDRAPDWAWRFTLVRDGRPDSGRPAALHPLALSGDLDPNAAVQGYLETAQRHAETLDKTNPRTVLFYSNLGLVRFVRSTSFKLTDASLTALADPAKNVPQDVFDGLEKLKNREILEDNLFNTLKDELGLDSTLWMTLKQDDPSLDLAVLLDTLKQEAEQTPNVLTVQHHVYSVQPEDPDTPGVFARHVASLEPTAEPEPQLILPEPSEPTPA